jgi:hypothetical protein
MNQASIPMKFQRVAVFSEIDRRVVLPIFPKYRIVLIAHQLIAIVVVVPLTVIVFVATVAPPNL